MEELLEKWILSDKRSSLRSFLIAIQRELPSKANIFMVGGLVRDILLEVPESKDIDLMVDRCGVDDLQKILQKLQDSKSIKKFQCVGKSFPVWKLRIKGFDEEIDLALARVEKSTGPGHKDFYFNAENISAKQDGERRDFTINAIFVRFTISIQDQLEFELIDYFGGLEDLQIGKIKAVGDPKLRILEDPLRILRALRFSHQRRFSIDRNLWEVIKSQSAHLIPHLSPDRIQVEVIKTIAANPRKAVQNYLECGLLEICFPNLRQYLPQQTPKFFPVNSLPSNIIVFPLLLCPWLELKEFDLKPGEIKTLVNILQLYHIPNIREIRAIITGFLRLINRYNTNYPDALQEKVLVSHVGSEILWLYTEFQRKFQLQPLKTQCSLPPRIDGSILKEWGLKPGPGFENLIMRVRQIQIEGITEVSEIKNRIMTELTVS